MPVQPTRDQRRPGPRGLRASLAAAVVLLIVTGCSTVAPAPDATADGLLALAATSSGQTLTGWAGTAAKGKPIDLPKGDTTWISVGRANVLAATLADGSLATSDPLHLGSRLVWRFVDAKDHAGHPPKGPGYFGTWDPGGGVIAELTGDLGSGDGVEVVIVDPSAATASPIKVDRPVVGAPPVWVGADRLVLITGDTGTPTSTVVDTANGDLSDGPGGVRLAAASADLKRVATMAGPGQPIIIRDLAGWLAGDGSSLGAVEPPEGIATAVAFALDTTGQRLAIAWTTSDGKIRLAVHDGRNGWRRTAQPTLDAAKGAAVAWQR